MEKYCLRGSTYLIVMNLKKNREFVNNICSHHQPHRFLITCIYCQNDFKTFIKKDVQCSSCCQLIQRKLKTYTFDKFKKIS